MSYKRLPVESFRDLYESLGNRGAHKLVRRKVAIAMYRKSYVSVAVIRLLRKFRSNGSCS
jgi:hypothetical protein